MRKEPFLAHVEGFDLNGLSVSMPAQGAILGGFDLRALREIALWGKLLETDTHTPFHVVLIRAAWAAKEVRLAQSVIPRDLQRVTILADDSDGLWQATIGALSPESSFFALLRDGYADPLVVGPPVESVWDDLRELLLAGRRQFD